MLPSLGKIDPIATCQMESRDVGSIVSCRRNDHVHGVYFTLACNNSIWRDFLNRSPDDLDIVFLKGLEVALPWGDPEITSISNLQTQFYRF